MVDGTTQVYTCVQTETAENKWAAIVHRDLYTPVASVRGCVGVRLYKNCLIRSFN